MKKLKSLLMVLIMLALILLPSYAQAATIKISKTKAIMEVDSTLKLKITGTKAKATWKTSKKSVATVKDGVIKAIKEGQVTITAKVDKKNYSCIVTVVDSQQDEITAKKGTVTELSTGLYIIGEDFPSGKYNVRALYNSGNFFVDGDNHVNEIMAEEGDEIFDTHEYKNLRLYHGDEMKITNGVVLEFTKLD